jgi:hypothetical protein
MDSSMKRIVMGAFIVQAIVACLLLHYGSEIMMRISRYARMLQNRAKAIDDPRLCYIETLPMPTAVEFWRRNRPCQVTVSHIWLPGSL